MYIKSLTIPEGHRGLHAASLSALGRIVLLAGPNGGGKTRVLETVSEFSRTSLSTSQRELLVSQRDELSKHIRNVQAQRDRTPAQAQSELAAVNQWMGEIGRIDERLLEGGFVELDRPAPDTNPTVVMYGVGSLDLRDWKQYNVEDIEKLAETVTSSFGLTLFNERLLAAIFSVGNGYFLSKEGVRSGDTKADDPVVVEFARRFEGLKSYIKDFLGTELKWIYESGGGPALFGKRIAHANLSLGQRVLLSIATSLALQDGTKEDLIVLLDEPENHLHPSALIDLIETVVRCCPRAQIWIATHSVSLLAHFGTSSLWSVQNGLVSNAARSSEAVLLSLLGGESGMESLRSFLALPVQSAITSFAAQCLLPPHIADTPPGDPQTNHIASVLSNLRTAGRRLRVLDYGIGSGRLLQELEYQASSGSGSLATEVDFFGVDHGVVSETTRSACLSRIETSFPGEANARYFIGDTELRAHVNPGSVDVVVLCNVLHEIHPADWLSVLGSGGTIFSALSDQGYLLIVEDQQLSVGERAHDFNFLVLDEAEIRSLFGVSPESDEIRTDLHPDPKYSDRLKVHLIPKLILSRLSRETRRRAIASLTFTSMQRAKALAPIGGPKAGRQYAFWTMQHFNATLAAEKF